MNPSSDYRLDLSKDDFAEAIRFLARMYPVRRQWPFAVRLPRRLADAHANHAGRRRSR
jgi:hypothetical protein